MPLRFVKMPEPRDLIERVPPEPIGRKDGEWWFLLEYQVERHQTLGRDGSDNQMALSLA